MTRQKLILMIVALALIGSAAGVLSHLKKNQRLGEPGVKTRPIANSGNVEVLLPERVLDYQSEFIPQDQVVTNVLPADTSYGQRRYFVSTNSWLLMNVVLMGADRTSIHKPQYCLEGAGWRIDHAATAELTIPVERPQPYQLPVIKIVTTREIPNPNGQLVPWRGIYVYWFVADGVLSGDKSGSERMWGMARHLLQTGELQRWAYVSCFAVCPPGYENATYERMARFIAAAVPEFQLTPKPGAAIATTKP